MEINKTESYGIAKATFIACSITIIPLCNELTITSRPNVVVIPLSCDSLIISHAHITS